MFVCIINCSCDLYCRYEMCCITRVEYRAKRNIFKCKYCLWICPLMIIIWSMLSSSPCCRYNIWYAARLSQFSFPFLCSTIFGISFFYKTIWSFFLWILGAHAAAGFVSVENISGFQNLQKSELHNFRRWSPWGLLGWCATSASGKESSGLERFWFSLFTCCH